jgi:hypothetical protein
MDSTLKLTDPALLRVRAVRRQTRESRGGAGGLQAGPPRKQ